MFGLLAVIECSEQREWNGGGVFFLFDSARAPDFCCSGGSQANGIGGIVAHLAIGALGCVAAARDDFSFNCCWADRAAACERAARVQRKPKNATAMSSRRIAPAIAPSQSLA